MRKYSSINQLSPESCQIHPPDLPDKNQPTLPTAEPTHLPSAMPAISALFGYIASPLLPLSVHQAPGSSASARLDSVSPLPGVRPCAALAGSASRLLVRYTTATSVLLPVLVIPCTAMPCQPRAVSFPTVGTQIPDVTCLMFAPPI
ncbi:hypothetical protein D9756_004839 [Leucocoprinus leucothites]|uniref:Uncharacterized protein n=1 Tax=Leucocoprinus leucothites TaxID=201217 RepID=A0A8H5LKX7_9AGAR|nr:hypothetical protein D9756_004839 [Leucoagaricus leucothites]